jgi:two-component system phosphate regulon sensor histidine kinase PhoR
MYRRNGQIVSEARRRTSSTIPTGGQPATWSMRAAANPQIACDFEAVLLAIAAHGLRQPLQILQSIHERLGIDHRTNSELRLLERGQGAADRPTEQLNELVGASSSMGRAKAMNFSPVRVDRYWGRRAVTAKKTRRETESIPLAPTSVSIMSNSLRLGTVHGKLVSNAVKYTRRGEDSPRVPSFRATHSTVSPTSTSGAAPMPASSRRSRMPRSSCGGSAS